MTSVARLNSSGFTSRNGAKIVAIASFTQTSIGPSCVSTASAAASTCSWVGDVGRQYKRLPAERLDLLAGSFETLLTPRDQANVSAALCEGVSNRPPDTPRGSGNYDDFLYPVLPHAFLLFRLVPHFAQHCCRVSSQQHRRCREERASIPTCGRSSLCKP